MTSILLGLTAALCWGFVDVLAAIYSRRHGTTRAVAVASVGSMVIYLIALWLFPQRFALKAVDLWAFAALGAVIAFTYLAFYEALARGPLSVVAPVMSTYAAVIVLLSLALLGERLSSRELLGATLAFLGVLGCSIRSAPSGVVKKGGVALAVVAMLGFGVSGYGGGILAKEHGWLIPPLITRAFITPLLFFVLFVNRPKRDEGPEPSSIGARDLGVLLIIGVIEGMGFLAFSRGAEVGLISLVAVASAAYPLIPLALGIKLFGEKLGPIQWGGVFSVFVGLALLGSAQ